MRKILYLFTLFVMHLVHGANSDTLTVNMEVQVINELSIQETSITLTINTAVAGSPPTDDTATANYDISTNEASSTTKKITGKIDTAMPANLTLKVNATAPTTAGTSAGEVTLTASDQDLVTGIDADLNETGLDLDFTFQATISAGVVSSFSRTFTLSLVNQ